MVGKLKKNVFSFICPPSIVFFRFQKQFLTTMVGTWKKNVFSFICPPFVFLLRSQTQFLTTYGGQIEETRVSFICPPLVFLFRFQKQFLTTYGGQIEEKRVFVYLPTISCFCRFQKPFLTTYGGLAHHLLFFSCSKTMSNNLWWANWRKNMFSFVCPPLVVCFRFQKQCLSQYSANKRPYLKFQGRRLCPWNLRYGHLFTI